MNAIYGYARVSTPKQVLDRQIKNIKAEYPSAIIFSDEYTGTKMNRPSWIRLMAKVSEGDTIIFDSVSRMSRNAEEGIEVYMNLFSKGINLVFLKEHHIDTATYQNAIHNSIPMTGTAVDCILEGINQYLMVLAKEQIRLAFDQAEKEVMDLRQRTKEGIAISHALKGTHSGVAKGQKLITKKSIKAKEIIKHHSKDFGGSLNDIDCMKLAGVARNTYYKYKAELKEGN